MIRDGAVVERLEGQIAMIGQSVRSLSCLTGADGSSCGRSRRSPRPSGSPARHPFYVEIGDHPRRVHRSDVAYFLRLDRRTHRRPGGGSSRSYSTIPRRSRLSWSRTARPAASSTACSREPSPDRQSSRHLASAGEGGWGRAPILVKRRRRGVEDSAPATRPFLHFGVLGLSHHSSPVRGIGLLNEGRFRDRSPGPHR